MAMKKKFLGLAMAAAVALPVGVYAAPADGYQAVDMGETETKQVTIPVTGSIKNKEGQAPAGRIEVELPTKMAFTVDENGTFSGATYTIQNKSSEAAIDVSVASFSGGSNAGDGSSNGIKLHKSGTISADPTQKYRNEVELKLTNSKDGKEIDLGDFANVTDKKLATVKASETASVVLSGFAGTKSSDSASSASTQNDVDKKGASEDFNLVFEIKKNKEVN